MKEHNINHTILFILIKYHYLKFCLVNKIMVHFLYSWSVGFRNYPQNLFFGWWAIVPNGVLDYLVQDLVDNTKLFSNPGVVRSFHVVLHPSKTLKLKKIFHLSNWNKSWIWPDSWEIRFLIHDIGYERNANYCWTCILYLGELHDFYLARIYVYFQHL